VVKRNELTDENYWNRHWQHRPRVEVIDRGDPFYGERGILLRAIRRFVPDLDRRKVVELGGGASYRLLALTRWSGQPAVAVDFSAEGLETITAIFAANEGTVETALADVMTWDADGRRFDLIVHWGLLEHFADPAPLVAKCASLLSPGGVLLFSMPNMEAWGAYFWRRFCPVNWSHHVFHPDEAVTRACIAAGLEAPTKFYFGYPLVHISDWEGTGFWHRLGSATMATVAKALVGLGWIIPLYHRGTRRISVERSFVTRKTART
jgi:2-polyprenyl-3-methyl-5-hydroxy-6-metoxy-1,4-benzoquinol methylase